MPIPGYQQVQNRALLGAWNLIGSQGLEEHPVGQHICTWPPSSNKVIFEPSAADEGGSLARVSSINQQPFTASQLQRG